MSTSKMFAWVCAWGLALAACAGTEGGNPLDERDGGPIADGSLVCDDGGELVRPTLCEPDDVSESCTCRAGDAAAFFEIAEGYGQRVRLYGPTSSGGFVALHTHLCVGDCDLTRRATLTVRRFDGSGAALGAPVEVTRSSAWVEQGAALEGDVLTLVFADEREGPSVASALHFGRFDVATGTWLVEPRVALPDAGFVTNVALARSSEGYAVVFTRTHDTDASQRGGFFVALTPAGDVEGSVVAVAEDSGFDASSVALASRADGTLLGRWTATSLEWVPLDASGSVGTASAVVNVSGPTSGPSLVPVTGGFRAAWSDGSGLRVARLDATGALIGTPTEVGHGRLEALVADADGVVSLLWSPRVRCDEGVEEYQERVLTRLDTSGTLLVHRGTGQTFDGSLVGTGGALRGSVVTYGPSVSTAWTVPVCAP